MFELFLDNIWIFAVLSFFAALFSLVWWGITEEPLGSKPSFVFLLAGFCLVLSVSVALKTSYYTQLDYCRTHTTLSDPECRIYVQANSSQQALIFQLWQQTALAGVN
jgi:hypothetical protein